MRHYIEQLTRQVPNLFWNFVEQGAVTGVSRLLLFPIAAHLVGKGEFGLFATALSAVLIIGVNPANGLAVGLLRNMSRYGEDQQRKLVRTALGLSCKLIIAVVVALLFISSIMYYERFFDVKTYLCVIFLGMSLYAENQIMLVMTPLRFRRQFKSRSLWYLAASLATAFMGVVGCAIGGVVGLAAGMMLSNYLLYFLAQRRFREPHVTPQAELATVLKGVWFHMTLAGMLVQAGPHLNRIVLRIFWDNEAVADLFAATGIVYLFVTPVSNSGALLLSMISKYNSVKEISRNTYRLILGMMVALGAGGMLFFYFLSPLMLRLLFPGFGNRAVGLFPILIWMIPANFVIAFVRPLITKFAKVAWIPTINFSVLLLIIVLMFSLVPKWGLIGAAYSICIGNVAEAVLRLVVFAMIYHGRQRDDQDDKGAETPPPSDARNLISRPADTCDA